MGTGRISSLIALLFSIVKVTDGTATPTPTASCSSPMIYFLDANNDGLIDIDGAQWYGWYNSDSPDSTGDYATIGYVNGRYWYSQSSELYFCPYPIDVQCVTADGSETPWYDLKLKIVMNRNFGCYCVNDQNGWACVDLMAKFLCPPANSSAYYGCDPPPNYIPANSSIGSASASISQSSSFSRTPSPTSSCIPQKYFLDANQDGFIDVDDAEWYGWYSIDGPGGMGEYEHINYVNGKPGSILSDLSFCPYPLDVQCVEFNSETAWYDLGLNIHFDKHYGCYCLNSENGNACVNMKVKYLCPPASAQAYYGCNPPLNYIPEGNPLASFSSSNTNTATNTAISTSSSSNSKSASASATSTNTESATNTPTASRTPTPSNTAAPSNTAVSTNTPTTTSSNTTTFSNSPTSSNSLIISNTPSPSSVSNISHVSNTTTFSNTPTSSNSQINSAIYTSSNSPVPQTNLSNTTSNTFSPMVSIQITPSNTFTDLPTSSQMSLPTSSPETSKNNSSNGTLLSNDVLSADQNSNANSNQSTPELTTPLTVSLVALVALAALLAFIAYRLNKKKKEAKKIKEYPRGPITTPQPLSNDMVLEHNPYYVSNDNFRHSVVKQSFGTQPIRVNRGPNTTEFNNPLMAKNPTAKVAFPQMKINK